MLKKTNDNNVVARKEKSLTGSCFWHFKDTVEAPNVAKIQTAEILMSLRFVWIFFR